ncbi:ATP-binding cassette domain-containing protein [Microbacterium gorillae]|uniref:ATP-binding cassette domain-containing protein n=1 Tax=Microbacterium gorillae TaxID=1231063 RepID=UPI000591073E|nr:ATP-binding cassette domain-containing protein [Microbacterium gorillae]
MTDPLVRVDALTKEFTVRERGGKRVVRALDEVTVDVRPGETLGVVGESGSGKSTLGRAILQLETPSAGSVTYAGTELTGLRPRERRPFQRRMQVIYQDPFSSLNPVRTALQQVAEPVTVLRDATDPDAVARDALARVGIAGDRVHDLPRAFSGGQRQRIAIARAIAVRPEFIVCDEPVSALDMSIQAQVVDLLRELQDERGLTYLFISHDLSVVREIATRTAVLYRGRLVEIGPTDSLFRDPQHAYTRRLLDAVLVPDPAIARRRLEQLSTRVAAPVDLPPTDASAMVEVAPGHLVLV